MYDKLIQKWLTLMLQKKTSEEPTSIRSDI